MKTVTTVTCTHLTGEVSETVVKKKTYHKAGFTLLFDDSYRVFDELVKCNDLYAMVVYIQIIKKLQPNKNVIVTSSLELSVVSNYAQRNIKRALDVLQAVGAILHSKIPNSHNTQIIVNPKYVFKGNASYAEVAKSVWSEQYGNFLNKRNIVEIG